MKLQILCRGSIKEGLGHLLRTRTFARHAQSTHEVEVVAIVEPGLEPVLSGLDCPLHCVRDDNAAVTHVNRFEPDVFVFDVTWCEPVLIEAATRRSVLVTSISPVFAEAAKLDVLFSRSARAEAPSGVQVLGGLQYAIVGEHCHPVDDEAFERSLALPELPVAICMGGADAANKTLSVLRALTAIPEPLSLIVLLGEGYAHSFNALVDAVRNDARHEVVLAKTNRSMWRLMSQCAVAVLAGGITTIEAVHAGLPTINLFEQPVHQAVMDELLESGVCLNGGLFSERSLATTVQLLRDLNRNREKLRHLRERTRGLVDRHGPARVLREMEQRLLSKALRTARNPENVRPQLPEMVPSL